MKWLAFLVAGTLPLSVLALPAQGSSSAKLITTTTRFSTSIPAVAATATATGHASSPSGGGDGGLTTPSCDALVKQCVIDDAHAPTGPFSTAFNKYSCVMAFACRARNNQTPDQLLYEMTGGKNPPKSFDLPRFSPSIFAQHSSNGKTWTQQNFIDAFYGKLSEIGGPFPNTNNWAIEYWSIITQWTGLCFDNVVPYQSLADWYQYSSTVQGSLACVDPTHSE